MRNNEQFLGYPVNQQSDLWLLARAYNAASDRTPKPTLKQRILSLRGQPAKKQFVYSANSAAPADSTIIPDLNKYRAGANLRALAEEAGIKHLILRMGGPAQFVYDNWMLTEDATYRTYYTQAKKLGLTVGGYIVYSAGIDQADYAHSHVLLDFADRICQGNDYKPDYMLVDDEVNTWWQNGKQVTATDVNQITGLKYLLPSIWDHFKLVPVHYSGRWFINQYLSQYTTMFDNMNGTSQGKTVLNWFAYYLDDIQYSNKMYQTAAQLKAELPIYSSKEIDNYLSIGSYSLYDLHQLTSNWITPFVLNSNGLPSGIDASVTRKSEQLFFADLNLQINPDTSAPSVPQNVRTSTISSDKISLLWDAARDNISVQGYSVFVNDQQIATTSSPDYTISNLQAGTGYTISVDAFDAAGNHSSRSASITATTLGKGCSPVAVIAG